MSSSTFDLIASTQLKYLPDRADVLRKTVTADGIGGTLETWETVYENIECRIGNYASGFQVIGMSTIEKDVFDKLSENPTHVFTASRELDLRMTDRVRYNGVLYEVIAASVGSAYKTACRAIISAVQ